MLQALTHDYAGEVQMDVSLTPELARLVEEMVRSGRYASTDDVVREALLLLDRRDHARQAKLEALRREIDIGMADIERGDVFPAEQVIAELREKRRRAVG